MDVSTRSIRTGASKPCPAKNPVGKKRHGRESYRLCVDCIGKRESMKVGDGDEVRMGERRE